MSPNLNNANITIITTFRDDYQELLKTIRSIQLQKKIEIFHILLNASNFNSNDEDIMQYFQSSNTDVLNTKGLGQYFCINKGINLVQTKYFLIINSGTTFVDHLSIHKAMQDVSYEDIIFNSSVVISPNGSFINKPSIRLLPYGVHHEACIYSSKEINHDLSIGHVADLDFMSKHLKAAKAHVKINTKPFIFYPRGGVSDITPIDFARVFNTVVVSYRMFFRGQFKASYRVLNRAVKDFFLLVFGRAGAYGQ